eukprot:TRINITY_DN7114_c0_g1_i1.p1 TRINITY_DN7114_c0_g1~~TRINITY_DN7114_c0_g1_i1.p1  ORF type:complete len:687 (-),score=146.36 TRINITY_DN7114_c0_g1_i1:152-2212(-)
MAEIIRRNGVEASPTSAGASVPVAHSEFLVVFAHHPCYFNMRFLELESLASMHGVTSRAELYVEDPPPTALSDSPLVRVRLVGGEATARAICERAVLVKAILDVWGEGPNLSAAVASSLACDPVAQAERRALLVPPRTMQIRVVAFGKTASAEEKRDAIQQVAPLFTGEEAVDLNNPDVVIWALEEYHHITDQKTHLGPRTGEPRRAVLGRQVACGRSTDKKIGAGDKAYFQRYDLANRAVLGPTTLDNQLAFIMANCACAQGGQVSMDPFCGTGGLLIALSHFGTRVVGGEIDVRVVKGWRVAYLKNKKAAQEVAARCRGVGGFGGGSDASGRTGLATTLAESQGGGAVSSTTAPHRGPSSGCQPTKRTQNEHATAGGGCDSAGTGDSSVAPSLSHLVNIGLAPKTWLSDAETTKDAPGSDVPAQPTKGDLRRQRKEQKRQKDEAEDGPPEDADQKHIYTNFMQYGFPLPEVVICDAAARPWRRVDCGWVDCIVTDPPYGVRAGSKKQGRDPAQVTFEPSDRSTYIPSKVSYGEDELSHDLLELAAVALTDGGRIVYLVPVDLADFLGISRHAESGAAAVRATGGNWSVRNEGCIAPVATEPVRVSLHDAAMPSSGRVNKDPRLCISETTRDPRLLNESRYLDFLSSHEDLELVGASLQILSGGLGRLLVTMRRKPRGTSKLGSK